MTQQQTNEFSLTATPEKSIGAQLVVSRQAQEVQAAMVMAKQFPRNEDVAYARVMRACSRRKVAEEAAYEFPRGGSKVTGPSIRLAEVLAQNWGNIDYGILELEQSNGKSEVMAYAWDLETNTRRQIQFTVNHTRSARGSIQTLTDPRDIYEMVANQGARRVRSCILGVIPGDVVDAAVEQCQLTLTAGHKEPLRDRIRSMIATFEKDHQVTKEMLEKYIGCSADAFSENDFIRLGNVYRSLRDKMGKREDYFEIPKPKGTESRAEAEFKQNAAASKAGASDDGKAAGTN